MLTLFGFVLLWLSAKLLGPVALAQLFVQHLLFRFGSARFRAVFLCLQGFLRLLATYVCVVFSFGFFAFYQNSDF